MKWKSFRGRRVFNKGRGYSQYEHAVMHISVYTEAFDNCIHRIEYLNKYKNILRIRYRNRSQMKFIKRQKTEACALRVNKKKKVAGQHPSHIDFLFIDCYNSNPKLQNTCHKQNNPGNTSNKQRNVHTLQQSSLKLPKLTLKIHCSFSQGLTGLVKVSRGF